MDILGIGPVELAFIFLIALILLGPKEMQKAGRTIGRWLRDFASSDNWRAFRETSREIRNLPNRLMREANLEDMKSVSKDMQKVTREINESVNPRTERFGTWEKPASSGHAPADTKPLPEQATENQIDPPNPPSEEETSDTDA